MRIFPGLAIKSADPTATRNVEIDSIHKEVFNYSERIAADPRIKKYAPPTRHDSEIRSKLKNHQQKKEAEQLAAIEASRVNAAKKADIAQQVEAGVEVKNPSDIALNNPQDPNTKSKLKEAVKMGTFNFSDKERKVLQQILNKEE